MHEAKVSHRTGRNVARHQAEQISLFFIFAAFAIICVPLHGKQTLVALALVSLHLPAPVSLSSFAF